MRGKDGWGAEARRLWTSHFASHVHANVHARSFVGLCSTAKRLRAAACALQMKRTALVEGHVSHFLYDQADFVAHMHRCTASNL